MSVTKNSELNKIGLNTVSLLNWHNLKEIIDLLEKHQIHYISLWDKDFNFLNNNNIQPHSFNTIKEFLSYIKERKIKIQSLCRSAYINYDNNERNNKNILYNKQLIALAKELGAKSFIIVIGGSENCNYDVLKSNEIAFENLKILYDFAKAIDIKLSLEPFHKDQEKNRSTLTSLQEAFCWCKEIDKGGQHLGVVVDTFHLRDEKNAFSLIESNKDLIFDFHISDNNKKNLNVRDICGNGNIDLKGFINVINKIKYQGPIEIEILNNDRKFNNLNELDLYLETATNALNNYLY